MKEILYQEHPCMFRNRPLSFLLCCVLIAAVGLGLLILLVWWIYNKGTTLTITTEKITLMTGLLSKNIDTVNVHDVRNIKVNQSLGQRIFGVGNMNIATSGTGGYEISVAGIPDPVRAKELIESHHA